ncbi:MAG TPA: universal stress protein [Syntrophomonadaceae bacterium]|nr:universal stress protein [Syntrophomonadaceae bacterium]
MFKHILVPVDGSIFSINAARKAVELAETLGSKITLLHVISQSHLAGVGHPQSMYIITDSMVEVLKSGADKVLEETLEAINPTSVEIKTEIGWGTPSIVIIDKTKEDNCDLIIMGNRGLGVVSGLLLGGVSSRVIKIAPCPVMIIKDN